MISLFNVTRHDVMHTSVTRHELQYLFVTSHYLIYNYGMKKKPMTPAERKKRERDRKKELGLVSREVWAHPNDWPKIRELESELKVCRLKDHD